MPKVELPPKTPGGGPNVSIEGARSIVIVGANGTGKTRMGAFIEEATGENAHRVGAQRSLSMPPFVQPRPFEQAQSMVRYGHFEQSWKPEQHVANRSSQRWGDEPFTRMLNDYEHVLALLFADESKRNRDYTRSARQELPKDNPPKCKLDELAEIWEAIMPQRELLINDDKIDAKTHRGQPYQGRHMSDGERVAVYLMGQALCAPEEGVVIIDEPELHLHRAIQPLLWDQIESKRPDCTFVYITHDLDFAVTRVGARRIWLEKFDGTDWVWNEIETNPALPDTLLLQVLGSRRPLLLVEGDDKSHDVAIYSALYPKEFVVPCKSCDKVIEVTKAMTALPYLHHLAVRGLVDRDRRSEEEVTALKDSGVIVADVAEVENLMCLPEAIEAIAVQLKCDNVAESRAKAETRVLDELNKQIDKQALMRSLADIQFRLNGFGTKIGNMDAKKLEADLNAYLNTISVDRIVNDNRYLFQNIVDTKDFRKALRFYNNKGVVAFVAESLEIKPDMYKNLVLKLLKDDPASVMAAAMRTAVEVRSNLQ